MKTKAAKKHQYLDRSSGRIVTEKMYHGGIVDVIYSGVRERCGTAFDLLVSPRMSSLIAWTVFDMPYRGKLFGRNGLARALGIDLSECEEREKLTNPRAIFERKICYWKTRPMDSDERTAVSPADSRMSLGSFRSESLLFLKEKFFSYDELLGSDKTEWLDAFRDGDYAVFRLTPDKYHWNHAPVSGIVRDFYRIEGSCHSCNPNAVVAEITPYSKNRRQVTVIDTDVEGGSRMGLVAMIEVAALMIGNIVQRYSDFRYEHPVGMSKGLFLKRGQAKSLFAPGSSVDVLIFQKDRIAFRDDLVRNSLRTDVQSRYSVPFGRPLVETDLRVRSDIGSAL